MEYLHDPNRNWIYIGEEYWYSGKVKREKLDESKEEAERVIRRPIVRFEYINGLYLLVATSVTPQPSPRSVGSVKDLSIIIPKLILRPESQKRYYIDQAKI